MRWRKRRYVKVIPHTSDLFHKDVPFEFIDKVFAVMALSPQHTFQILTKRPERMAEYCGDRKYEVHRAMERMCSTLDDGTVPAKMDPIGDRKFVVPRKLWANAPTFPTGLVWPLHNVWLLTSIEDQSSADERVPHILRCPAAVRGLSIEPLLGPIDLTEVGYGKVDFLDCLNGTVGSGCNIDAGTKVDWVIAGGESGPHARPCNLEWIRSIVRQCADAGVPCFVKQMGSGWHSFDSEIGPPMEREYPYCEHKFEDRKGADPAELAGGLRVQQMPEQKWVRR